MNKTISYIIILALVLVGVFYYKKFTTSSEEYKNINYTIEGIGVVLKNGIAKEASAPGSSSQVVTKYFGNELRKDLNNDGKEDVAFFLTQETGGSGAFFYVVAAIKTDTGYTGSHAVFIGDRIAPQNIESGTGDSIIVNYMTRKADEPMTVNPSVGMSLVLKLDPSSLYFGQIIQNFEGEADPSKMTLGMKTWSWVSATYSDGKSIVPKQSGKFTLTFKNDGKFTATTDCNSMGGSYSVKDKTISFSDIFSTKMYCEGSQEEDFSKLLENSTSYFFNSKGQLVFDLKFDSGSVIFK